MILFSVLYLESNRAIKKWTDGYGVKYQQGEREEGVTMRLVKEKDEAGST